jgi:HD-GYP domain-containing protein (c-di-GMP phosphodiesterase class II)
MPGMDDDKSLQTKLLDIRDSNEILKEVKFTTSLINPQFDFQYLDYTFNDIVKLFQGQYAGFRGCNTGYHDLTHTMMVLLAMARLIHGASLQGITFTDKEINLGLVSALMHDTGYIQTADDNFGTGGKYALIHIKRSVIFVQDYYASEKYFQHDLDNFRDILYCTGLSTDFEKIAFSSANIEIMGKILGTADLLGQMADRFYLEKLILLFHEFEEGNVPGFESEIDLLRKTANFYKTAKARFENELGNVNRFMISHFQNRWNIERNIYDESIKKNINYLKYVLKSDYKNLHDCLRRKVSSDLTHNDQATPLMNQEEQEFFSLTDSQMMQIRRLTRIGTALSAEKNIERLFELIVDEARKFTGADGGTLYITSDDETELHFAIVQTESLNVRMGGTGGKITWKPVRLHHDDGTPNHGNVSAHVALTGEVVNISDVYTAKGFDFKGTRDFDTQTGYRSQSMLVVPMKNHNNDIIGILQLLNAQNIKTGDVISFSLECQEMTESLASQAAVALSNNRLIHELENLMESFIRTIGAAIDEKSPYTGGHVRRVADLTMEIARKVNDAADGPYATIRFSENELEELQIAAWLHDVGKITTPEYVVDKATKLATIVDRIELLRLRFALYAPQSRRRRQETQADQVSAADGKEEMEKTLAEEFLFLSKANLGSERMSDDMRERVRTIAARTWEFEGRPEPLLTQDEVENLSIIQGTLNFSEREVINNHAKVTYKILSQLPFPKKLRHVPEYAASHHETLNGKGYPRGLVASQLALQPRILALADIFEALTAKDRPYRPGKNLSEAIHIMTMMVKDLHLDPDLFDLFIREGIHLDYARRELSADGIDLPGVSGKQTAGANEPD